MESRAIGALAPDLRPEAGRRLNDGRQAIRDALDARKSVLSADVLRSRLSSERLDVTLPGRGQSSGGLHPVTRTLERISSLFRAIGFDVVEGPEIEDDYHNFEALNIPAHHPAPRDAGHLLRSGREAAPHPHFAGADTGHAVPPASTQDHRAGPRLPVRLRPDPYADVPSGRGADGRGGRELRPSQGDPARVPAAGSSKPTTLEVRFRPSYFPFTEPSAEVDIRGERGWLEVLGSGMVHPKVLENCGIDSERHTGFAFGMGVERFAMLRYGVDDLRSFFDNDLRFLRQFV